MISANGKYVLRIWVYSTVLNKMKPQLCFFLKKRSLVFDCFHVCVIRIGLRDVSVVRETEWLLERFFTFFDTLMVDLFNIEVNITNHNHKEVLIFDRNCYKRHLGSPRFEFTTFMTSFNVKEIRNTSPLNNDGIYIMVHFAATNSDFSCSYVKNAVRIRTHGNAAFHVCVSSPCQ